MSTIKLKGYRRGDSRFGIRNHIVVLSTVSCAN
ncbi:MAG: UxaA family hydrolase, partial [Planctomycetota bacterium]